MNISDQLLDCPDFLALLYPVDAVEPEPVSIPFYGLFKNNEELI